jgi:large subunit ribosomal protein L20
MAKGFGQARRRRYGAANEAVMHAGQYAYEGRKHKKRDFKSLWIMRISAAVKAQGLSYSKFMAGLKKNKIELNRKILAELAVNKPEVLTEIIAEAKK